MALNRSISGDAMKSDGVFDAMNILKLENFSFKNPFWKLTFLYIK